MGAVSRVYDSILKGTRNHKIPCPSSPLFFMINLQRNNHERRQMNSITELLDLEDADIRITDISIEGTRKILTLETKVVSHYCPI